MASETPRPVSARPLSGRGPQRVGSVASTTMRRRVLDSAALGEWDKVREAVEVQGCNLNIQDEESGLSLVHWASQQGNLEALQWMIEKNAFLRLKDKRGHVALDSATGPAASLLLQHAYTPLERLVSRQGTLSLGSLENELAGLSGEQLDEQLWDEVGATMVGVLAGRHDGQALDALPLLQWLAARGASLEALDEDGNALLHQIDWSQGAAVTEPILAWTLGDAGVQHFDVRNSDGDTPPLLCAYASPSGGDALRCLRLFEKAGANLALGSAKGMNVPMMLARYHGEGPWISWCITQAGVDQNARCTKQRTVDDYLQLFGTEESDDEN